MHIRKVTRFGLQPKGALNLVNGLIRDSTRSRNRLNFENLDLWLAVDDFLDHPTDIDDRVLFQSFKGSRSESVLIQKQTHRHGSTSLGLPEPRSIIPHGKGEVTLGPEAAPQDVVEIRFFGNRAAKPQFTPTQRRGVREEFGEIHLRQPRQIARSGIKGRRGSAANHEEGEHTRKLTAEGHGISPDQRG